MSSILYPPPVFSHAGVRSYLGNNLEILPQLPDACVQTCVTSPPYWGLRDYDHNEQIGLEETPEAYVAALVAVFREVCRVLKDDGTVWLNLGDSYASGGNGGGGSYMRHRREAGWQKQSELNGWRAAPIGLKDKDLVGIPWRVAFALQADGWYLRQDIIWEKPNPMPESVTDRCTKAHEYLFLLSKSKRYYFDAAAIAEPAVERCYRGSSFTRGKTIAVRHQTSLKPRGERPQLKRAQELAAQHGLTDEHIAAIRSAGLSDAGKNGITQTGSGRNSDRLLELAKEAKEALGGYYREFLTPATRNKRSVWTVPTRPTKEAHFATFPPNLIRPCILAGSRPGDMVLDPFAGSGTTGEVTIETGRDCILCELNAEYIDIQRRRLKVDQAVMFR